MARIRNLCCGLFCLNSCWQFKLFGEERCSLYSLEVKNIILEENELGLRIVSFVEKLLTYLYCVLFSEERFHSSLISYSVPLLLGESTLLP